MQLKSGTGLALLLPIRKGVRKPPRVDRMATPKAFCRIDKTIPARAVDASRPKAMAGLKMW